MDLGDRSRMMERQDPIVFVDTPYFKATVQYIFTVPISPSHGQPTFSYLWFVHSDRIFNVNIR